MNKKLLLGMFAAAGMLFATSCSNDELDVVQSGDEAQVTFSLAAEGGIATRAISDGKSANLLYYAIFDANKQLITTINGSTNGLLTKSDAFPNGSKQDAVEVTLAKGQEYTAVFWAQDANCTAYTVTAETDGLKVAVDYDGDNNDETRDAFFKAETFKVTGNTEIDVVLKRPFAQINVGVTEADWEAAVESGIEITESKVVIKNAATSINLLDGTVSGKEEVTYDFATIPAKFATAETLEVDVNRDGTIQDDEKYKYLSMSYILTDNDAERTTLEADGLQFTFSPENGEDIVFDEGLHAVPVQRNWRTNILGKILTGDIQFNIEIDQRFDDNYNLMYPDKDDNSTAVFNVTNATELQTALNNATDGAVIYFTNDITGDVTATQKPNVKVSILGQGYSFKGVITVDGKSATYTTAGLTIKDVVFDAQTISADACINLGKSGDNNTRYTCNVTVENCTFDVDNAVGIKSYTGGDKNLTITGCTATANAHSLVQVAGIDGILIENSTIKSVRGMNFNSSTNVTVDNCLVDVQKYAVRFGASSGGSGETEVYTIKNSSLKSVNVDDDAVIVLRGTADNSTLTIENTTIEGTKQIENTATNATVIIDIDGVPTVNSTTGLATVVAKGYTNINLVDGTYDMTKLTAIAGKTLTFVGAGENTIFDYSSQTYNEYVSGGNGTFVFKNMTIQRSTETFAGMAHTASTSYENCTITGTYYVYETTAKFTDCKFNVTGDFYNCWLYGTSSATYENCEFNCSGKSIYVDGNGETGIDLTTNTCVFNDDGGVENKAAIETGNTYGKRYSLTIINTTVKGFSKTEAKSPAVEGAELGTNVWGNKNYMTKDKLSVTIDGTKVY
ncbi:Uncharacterised protein [uncultured Bacteroides sp.]|uniref:DUF6562 domain-containing protein n=1 Tax=Bacteroides cellulolyticus TaxID=2981780 RepID=UPI0008227822|nr:DUF6562 domain-containing protein [Bacteroides cellulolyticus]MCU6772793.1 hypothetical protein [Bacteroides cellulolyticus]SCI59062.1 Uncharacterised protein [uncultured Bacteroides sp.]